jgi:two-component system nitrogen regulation sensor histidine kinase NtrY
LKVPESLRSRLKNNRWLFGGATLALAFFTISYYVILRSRDLDPNLVNNKVLLFTLRNVNVVLVLTICFVLIRNLFKLWLERQRRALGSKFKTKLVATYIGLTLIPVLLVFAYATQLMQGSFDVLFGTETEGLLEPLNNIAQELTSRIQHDNRRDAEQVFEGISSLDIEDPNQRPELDRQLKNQLRDLECDLIAVYVDTDFIHAVINSSASTTDLPEIGRDLLLQAIRNQSAFKVDDMPANEERLILAATSRTDPNVATSRVVVVGRVLSAELAGDTDRIVSAYQARRQHELLAPDIRATQLLFFLMVTLVVLLTSSWMGLYLARRVTVPIKALADATRHIGEGDFQYRVEAAADDELGVLVDSFNQMTGELHKSRSQIVESNQKLQEERALSEAILSNVAAGVVSIDRQGDVLTSNKAALEMLNLTEEEMLHRPLREAWADPDRCELLGLFDEELRSHGRVRKELHLHLNGELKTFEATSTEMHDDHGQLTGHVIVLEDLTELLKAQRLATWNEAARRIAHEIKNPLTPIKLSAERLRLKYKTKDPKLGQAIEEATSIIVKEVGSMTAMVDEFSRFARMPQTHMTKVDLGRLLDDTVGLYRDVKAGVDIHARMEGEERQASLDREQLRSALVNLIDNAVEATEAPGQIEVSAHRDNGQVIFQVKDTGRGIAPEAKEKLFMPYFSTKGRGTGLGLAIVHRIVTDHQGSIKVEDNRPTGTIFTIELPQ